MDLLRIAGATLNQIPLDWDGNTSRILKLLKQAQEKKVAVVCFPELSISGYNCEDMFMSLHVARQSMDCLLEIVKKTKDIVAIVGLPVYRHGDMYNCVAVLQNKKILGIIPKKVLPRQGVHYEPRWFKVWKYGKVSSILIDSETIPFGDLRFQFGKVGLGIEICEEAWGSQGPSAQAIAGTEIIMNPSASHFSLGKYKTRETLVSDSSRAMQVHYLYSNLLGLENGRIIFDGGVLLGSCGKIAARGSRFGFHDGALTIHDVDLDLPRVGKLNNRSFEIQDENDHPATIIGTEFFPFQNIPISEQENDKSTRKLTKEEEFLHAEMLGLFDYLRKTRSKGYVVSLSGGCDSSSCVVLIAHAIACAFKELGAETLGRVLGFSPRGDVNDPRAWVNQILTTLYQGTSNSGSVTREAARALAEAVGAEHHELEMQDEVSSYIAKAEGMIGRTLNWQNDDVALQNIQARARSPMAWLMANIKGAILIATSNRSEAAVGYATMDGDTSGGLSPLSGIDKYFLIHWLKWAEDQCDYGLGPISALSKVNSQQPTAELRPQDSGQTDESDLMPYSVLDRIERYFIRDRASPISILDKLKVDFPNLSPNDLKTYLIRFLRLWSQNQWKRERFAPSFHLDDESLDPKSWCRFPILSSGFAKEIEEL